MWIQKGAHVETAAGDRVGDVSQVVIHPRTREVTHFVITKGGLFAEDRVVPIDLIDSADEDRVRLSAEVEDLDQFPPFQETEFVDLNERELSRLSYDSAYASPLYWYPGAGAAPLYAPGYFGAYPGMYQAAYTTSEENIPEGTVAIPQGLNVITADGDYVGDVEVVLVDEANNQATGFVIDRGGMFSERKRVPLGWVEGVDDEKVLLGVGTEMVRDLPGFEE